MLFVEQNRHKNFRHVILWYAEKRFWHLWSVTRKSLGNTVLEQQRKDQSFLHCLCLQKVAGVNNHSDWMFEDSKVSIFWPVQHKYLHQCFFPDLTNMLQFYSVLKYVKKSETTFRNYNKLVQLCCVVYASISRG